MTIERGSIRVALLSGTAIALALPGVAVAQAVAAGPAPTATMRQAPTELPRTSVPAQSTPVQSAQAAPAEGPQEDIVVTGVLRDTAADKAAIATTTVDAQRIQEVVPISAADLLSEIPGVVVDSDVGETNNSVYTRGLSTGTSASTTGYYWTTILEDGLPIAPLFFSNYQPDQFLRPDVTLKRVQAVRGGSAAVTGPNAPGGLFNYISRNGMTDQGTYYSVRLGIEGDSNLYQKYEGYYGWRSDDRTVAFSIGGDYRRSYGYRDTPKPINDGGQIKANASWDYGDGGLLVSFKYLNDRASNLDQFRPLARGFDNPQFTEEFGRIVNFAPVGDIGHESIYNGQPGYYWDGNDGARYRSAAFAVKWDHDFGDGLKLSNNLRFHRNQGRQTFAQTSAYRSLVAADTWTTLGTTLAGLANTPGYFSVKDGASGQVLARVYRITAASQNSVCVAGRVVTNGYCIAGNTPNLLPNQQIVNDAPTDSSNLVLGVGSGNGNLNLVSRDLVDLFTATKNFGNLTLTAGAYYAHINFSQQGAFAGYALAPLETTPSVLDISFTTTTNTAAGGAAGTNYQLTSPNGFGSIGSSAGVTANDHARVRELSPLFGATWDITDRLLLDGGLRYTFYSAAGTNRRFRTNANAAARSFGGLDGDPLTIYDNIYAVDSPDGVFTFNKKVRYLQYTGAINWNINDHNTVYARYTKGVKNQDGFWNGFSLYQSTADDYSLEPLPTLKQAELSWTFRNSWMTNQAVVYYTRIDNTPSRRNDGILEDGITRYTTQPFLNVFDTLGLELDNKIRIFDWLSVRNVLTLNRSRALKFASVSLGTCNGVPNETKCPGGILPPDDDFATYISGPQERSPSVLYNGTVNVKFGPVSGYYRFRYVDDRPTSVLNNLFLPATKNSDIGVNWRLLPNANLSFNVNNLFNAINVTQIGAVGTLPSGVTIEQYQQLYPNALTVVRTNAPRSFFLTLSGHF